MSMGSLGFNQGRSDDGWRPLTLPLILSPSIWALVNNHQWVGPGDRSLALRKINISSLLKAASHLAQARKFHPRLSMMSQYQSAEKPHWAWGGWWYVEKIYKPALGKCDSVARASKLARGWEEEQDHLRTRGWLMEVLEGSVMTERRCRRHRHRHRRWASTNVSYWANWRDNTGGDEEGWGDAHTQICNLTSAQ